MPFTVPVARARDTDPSLNPVMPPTSDFAVTCPEKLAFETVPELPPMIPPAAPLVPVALTWPCAVTLVIDPVLVPAMMPA